MKLEQTTVAVLCVSNMLLSAACGAAARGPASPSQGPSTQEPATPGAPTVGPVDPALIGTWTGTVRGSFGPGSLRLELDADGRASFEGSGNYCRADGRWGVSGAEFRASGSDCTGTVVTLVAPASSSILAGNWQASSGRSGTFSLTRQ